MESLGGGFTVVWQKAPGSDPVNCGPDGHDVPQELALEWAAAQAEWFDQVEVAGRPYAKLLKGARA